MVEVGGSPPAFAPCRRHDVVYVLPVVEVAEVASAGARAGIVDVRGEVVAVDALGGAVLVRLKVARLLLEILLSEVETTAAGLDFQLTSMGFTRPPFFLLLLLP